MRAKEFLKESTNTNLLIVDVQPAYADYSDRVLPGIQQMIERCNGKIVVMYNGWDIADDRVPDVMNYLGGSNDLEDMYYDEENDDYIDQEPSIAFQKLQSAKFIEKVYGYFRQWMDEPMEMSDAAIIRTIRAMYQHRITDSREFEDKGINIADITGPEWNEKVGDPEINIYLPEVEIQLLRQLSPFYMMGGGRNECLREIELLCNAFNIRYKRIDSLIYG